MSINTILNEYLASTVGVKTTEKEYNVNKELNNLITTEFKKTYAKELYGNSKWTSRVFWVIVANIENDHEHFKLYDIVRESIKYIIDHNLPIPYIDWSQWEHISDEWKQISTEWQVSQRETVKLIRDSINDLQIDGITKTTDIAKHATDNGIPQERYNQAISQMKRDGSIFEPKEGFYKCIQ